MNRSDLTLSVVDMFSDVRHGHTWPVLVQLVAIVAVFLGASAVALGATGALSVLWRWLGKGVAWLRRPLEWLTSHRRHLAAAAVVVFLPFLAQAQVDAGFDALGAPTPQDVADLANALLNVKTLGWMVAASLGLRLLMKGLRLPFIEALLAGYTWLKPLLAVVLGVALETLNAIATGMPVLPAILKGATEGTIATGLRELGVAAWGTATKDERALGKAVTDMLKATDTTAAQKAEAIKAGLDEALRQPDEAAKLRGIAEALNAQKAG